MKNSNKEPKLSELKQAFADAFDEGKTPDLFESQDLILEALDDHPEDKEKQVVKYINLTTGIAEEMGGTHPPGTDLGSLIALQFGLFSKIADIWGYKIIKNDLLWIATATMTASSKKKIFRVTASTTTLAGAATYGFGHACNVYFKSGKTIEFVEIGDVFNDKCEEYKGIKCK